MREWRLGRGREGALQPRGRAGPGPKGWSGHRLWGSYYREGDSLHFEAQLIDAVTGRLMLSMEPAVGWPPKRPK